MGPNSITLQSNIYVQSRRHRLNRLSVRFTRACIPSVCRLPNPNLSSPRTRHEKTRQDKSRQDQAKQENTRHDKTMTRQNLTGLKIFLRGLRAFLSWGGMGEGVWRRVERKGVELRLGLETRQDKTRQIKTRQDRAKQENTRHDKQYKT